MTRSFLNIEYFNAKVELDNEARFRYEETSEIVNNTIARFKIPDDRLADIHPSLTNTFDVIQACYSGRYVKGYGLVRPEAFLSKVAEYFGWSRNMDMSNSFNQEINEYYNPNKINEACRLFNKVLTDRKKLLNGQEKIDKVIELVERLIRKNKGKILMMSSSTGFCNEVCQKLNEKFKKAIAVPYHSSIPSSPMMGDDGDFIRYSTGEKAGQIKTFGEKTLKKDAIDGIDKNIYKVMCITDKPDKSFYMDSVEVIIHTSPDLDDPQKIARSGRVKHLTFGNTDNKVLWINVFYADTKEEDKITNNIKFSKAKDV